MTDGPQQERSDANRPAMPRQYWSKEGALLADTDDGGLGLPVGRCGAWLMRLHAQLQAARDELAKLRAAGGASC